MGYNGDGFISLEEMTRYLTSVFKVMYETQPGTAERMGVSALELAAVTAEQAFIDADLNHDGRLSFEEFKIWYSATNGSDARGQSTDGSSSSSSSAEAASADSRPTLDDARELSRLNAFSVEEVFSAFADVANDDGSIDQESFQTV